jgi:hypothetical protein
MDPADSSLKKRYADNVCSKTETGESFIRVINKHTRICVLVVFLLYQILHVSKGDDRTQSIFEDAFVALGRLDNISLVMGFHPQYLEGFLRTQHYLLQMDGPLSLHYRHYIGIMVRMRPLKSQITEEQ